MATGTRKAASEPQGKESMRVYRAVLDSSDFVVAVIAENEDQAEQIAKQHKATIILDEINDGDRFYQILNANTFMDDPFHAAKEALGGAAGSGTGAGPSGTDILSGTISSEPHSETNTDSGEGPLRGPSPFHKK